MDEKSADVGVSLNDKKKTPNGNAASGNVPVKVRASNAKRHTRLRIIDDLQPFIPLLPDISGIDLKNQEQLFHVLYSAGVTVSLSLQKWLLTNNKSITPTIFERYSLPKQMNLATGQCFFPFGPDDAEALKTLTRSGLLDDAVEDLRQIPVNPEHLVVLSDAELAASTLISPEIAATALGAFASAAVRRPPTRAVETLMASTQNPCASPAAKNSTDEESLGPSYCDDNGDSLLGFACSAGYTDLARQLVTLRGNANCTGDKNDCTPLMEACSAGHIDIVKHLLGNSADVDALSATENTALIYAAAAGHVNCVQALIDHGCNIDARNKNGHCALMEGVISGYLEVVKVLVDAGASSVSMRAQCEYQVGEETPLALAAFKGRLEIAKYLLEKCIGKERQEELHTALMEASMDGHYEVARLLLDHAAPVNFTSDSCDSPLTLAACGGYANLVELLLDRGAEMEKPNDDGYTPLMEASREGHLDVVSILLGRGAETNTQTGKTGETALTLAAGGGFREVVEQLVNQGGDLNLGVDTPLMEAAQEGHLDIVQYILAESAKRNGLPVDARTASNQTALAYAAEYGHMDVCAALIEAGASVNREAGKGRTPLMKAAKNGNYGVAQFLIMRGAQVNKASSTNDATALSLACASGHWEIVRLLLGHGADPSHALKDGTTCMIEASRNGHTRVVDTLLNWHGVPVSSRCATANAKSTSLQNSTLEKVGGRQCASEKATTTSQPEVQCVEKALNSSASAQQGSSTGLGQTPSMKVSSPGGSSHATPFNLESQLLATAAVPGTSIPTHLLAHYCQHNASINKDELRGMIAGMATMAAQSNLQLNDHLFAQIAEKAIRGTMGAFSSQDPMGRLSEVDMLQQFSDMLREQCSILANRQKDALNATITTTPNATDPQLTDSDQGGKSSCSASITSSPPPPMVACCETTVARAELTPIAASAKRKNSMPTGTPKSGSSATRGQEKKASKGSMAMCEGVDEGLAAAMYPVNANVKFVASPAPVMNANVSREALGLPTAMGLKQTLTATVALIRSKLAPSSNTAAVSTEQQPPPLLDEVIPTPTTRSRRTVSESAARDIDARHCTSTEGLSCEEHIHNVCSKIINDTYGEDECLSEERSAKHPPSLGGAWFNVDMQTESNHDTALTLAASGGHDTLVDLLISRGAHIEHRDKKGFTALILATRGGHANVVEALLNAGANIEAQSERTKDTALSLACSGGRKEVVELLIKRTANKEHRNGSDYTPLSLAAAGGYVHIIRMLLNAGAEINSRSGSKLGISPLMLAAMNGQAEATKLLLDRGSDIKAHIETNWNTALTLACFQGRCEVVRLLIEYNADVEHRAKTGLTPLMEAANGGHADVGEQLLWAGADPNASPVPTSRDTALTIAADKGHRKFVKMLIHGGAQIDAHNKKGCTALWLACHGGHLETVQTLVEHNAEVGATDNRKVSPLIIAFRKGHVKVVKYMVCHVQQFPSDQECYRFLATVSDKDQQTKCHQCMDVIVSAKDREAAEANRAAQSLLDILANEEEKAQTKKLSKQRQNEKKKAKRRAKRPGTEEKTKPAEVESVMANDEGFSLEDGEMGNDKTREHPDEDRVKPIANIEVELPRVPSVISDQVQPPVEAVQLALTSPPPRTSAAQSSNAKSYRHRNRNDSGNVRVSSASCAATSKTVLSAKKQSAFSAAEAEWMKATSRRKKVGKVSSSTAKPVASYGITCVKEDATASNIKAWRHVDASKRCSSHLSVASNLIARVIGRAGGNINAIRDATGACIDVEKQSGKKEQRDRKITIKGSDTALRQAMAMINGLIVDSVCTVDDVIRRVTSSCGHSSASSSLTEELALTPSRSVTSTFNTAVSNPHPVSATTTTTVKKQTAITNSSTVQPTAAVVREGASGSKTGVPPQTTPNVWLQRAAQRHKMVSAIGCEKKHRTGSQSAKQPQVAASAPKAHVPVSQPSVDLPRPVLSIVDVGVIGERTRKPEQVQEVLAKVEVSTFSKAPGTRPSPGSTLSSPMSSAGVSLPLSAHTNSKTITSTAAFTQLPRTCEPTNDFARAPGAAVPITGNLGFGEIGSPVVMRKPVVNTMPVQETTKLSTRTEDNYLPWGISWNAPSVDSLANMWADCAMPGDSNRGSTGWSSAGGVDVSTPLGSTPLVPSSYEPPGAGLLASSSHPSLGIFNNDPHMAARRESLQLAHNIAQRRAHALSATGSIGEEEVASTMRGYGGEQRGVYPPETGSPWREDPLTNAPFRPQTSQSMYSDRENFWINSVATQLAGRQTDTVSECYPSAFTQMPTPIAYPSAGLFGNEYQYHSMQQQHPYNRVRLQQAAQAASNDYENLNMLLNTSSTSVRPPQTRQQQQPQPHQQHHAMGNATHLDTTNTEYGSGTVYHTNATRTALNTSIPPPPFFSAQVPSSPSQQSQTHTTVPLADSSALFGNSGWPIPPSCAAPSSQDAASHGTLSDAALLSQTSNRPQWNNSYGWQ